MVPSLLIQYCYCIRPTYFSVSFALLYSSNVFLSSFFFFFFLINYELIPSDAIIILI